MGRQLERRKVGAENVGAESGLGFNGHCLGTSMKPPF